MQSFRIQIFGIVQGVGFRPYIDRLAGEHGVFGTVANKGSFVEVVLQARDPAAAEAFFRDIPSRAPARSLIMNITREEEDLPPFQTFSIIESEREEGAIFVSPDIAICPECEQELFDPGNRRYLHPFINCTACGPRLSILDAMPYDRERTSMKVFPMCDACAYEYTHAETRRYDAQPVCCNDCGPRVTFTSTSGKVFASDQEAIAQARAALRAGKILAIKGIGGFHVACDAHNNEAVSLLRARKQRPAKPFAVMLKDRTALERYVRANEAEKELLQGWQKPIVLLPKKEPLADSVAPGNPCLGVLLPYTPLHHLLFSLPDGCAMTDALVMTSGNISGAPICHTNALVSNELGAICDAVLTHNRHINVRCDDSVAFVHESQPRLLRRSRGYAPLPIVISQKVTPHILAVGGDLKNTFCLVRDSLFYLSPHIGDLSDIRTHTAFRETLARLEDLLECRPALAACDMHPLYAGGMLAEETGLPLVRVQHHHAHILSCLAEHDVHDPVIGIALDGTGYGNDGTIWGGEILLTHRTVCRRFASIEPFPHTGGDTAAREGWRIATSLLSCLMPADQAEQKALELGLAEEKAVHAQMAATQHRFNTVTSTSAGRLFDAVSALLGFCRISTFEGEAACALEFAAQRAYAEHVSLPAFDKAAPLPNPTTGEFAPTYLLPTWNLLRMLLDLLPTVPRETLALFFHCALARILTEIAVTARAESGIPRVALSGGVFQNRLLLTLTEDLLKKEGFILFSHGTVPANDGGLALGQALYAAYTA